jgi:prophage DNA circulation protein
VRIYKVRELVIFKAKAEKIEETINELRKEFEEVVTVSRALDSAAKGMRDAISGMLAMPGRYRI